MFRVSYAGLCGLPPVCYKVYTTLLGELFSRPPLVFPRAQVCFNYLGWGSCLAPAPLPRDIDFRACVRNGPKNLGGNLPGPSLKLGGIWPWSPLGGGKEFGLEPNLLSSEGGWPWPSGVPGLTWPPGVQRWPDPPWVAGVTSWRCTVDLTLLEWHGWPDPPGVAGLTSWSWQGLTWPPWRWQRLTWPPWRWQRLTWPPRGGRGWPDPPAGGRGWTDPPAGAGVDLTLLEVVGVHQTLLELEGVQVRLKGEQDGVMAQGKEMTVLTLLKWSILS